MQIKHTHTALPLILLLAIFGAGPSFAANSKPQAAKTPPTQKDADLAATVSLQEGSAGSFLSSQFARQNGDVDTAISYLRQALAKNPRNSDLAAQLLALQIAKGDINGALATGATIKEKEPLTDLLATVALVKKNDYAGASKRLADSFNGENGQLWVPLVDAWIDAGKGDIKQAITIEEMPVTVGRAATVMNYHIALVNNYAGFTTAAATNFDDAVESPESAPLRVMQQIAYFSAKHPEAAKLKTLVTQYNESHGEALPPLESAIASPADGIAEVLYTMGNVMQMAGGKRDAEVYMQLARYLRPDFTLATFSLAEILADDGAYQRASDMLAVIPPSSQYAMKAVLRHGVILDRIGKTDEALQLLNNLAQQNPKATDPLIAKGDLLRVHNRFLEASIAYGEAIKRIDKPAQRDWVVYYARGACLERLGHWAEAKADLQKALSLTPNQPDVLNYLGYGMLTRGESVPEAKAMLDKAIAAAPSDAQIIDSMGWALYLLGEYKDALPYLERAAEMLASDATVNDHLGDLYWRLGRKTEARFQWQRALTFMPDEDETKKINEKLASGLSEIAATERKVSSIP